MSKPSTEIDGRSLEALIARVTEAKENNLALSSQDSQLLLDALLTLANMQDRLTHHNVTIYHSQVTQIAGDRKIVCGTNSCH